VGEPVQSAACAGVVSVTGRAPHGPFAAARIARRIAENRNTVALVLEARMEASPGQFAMLWLPGLDEKPYSIAECDPLSFAVANVGPFSAALHSLSPGDRLWYRGPFGRGFRPSAGRALLVGGGYGAAPLYFLARRLIDAGGGGAAASRPESLPVIALGARTSGDLLFVRRFEELGLRTHVVTEDGSAGTRGLVTGVVERLAREGGFERLYACGPEAMLEALCSLCASAGLPAELSHEGYMRCGVGLCGACERSGRLVCMDGPVFDSGA
jgi:dihydroorotate dehydrogenase electron transfer subunit